MSKQSKYIIQKQVFELSAPGSASDFEWERIATAFVKNILTPAIENCFNNLPYHNGHLVIDKLEINLGAFTRAGLEKEAALRLKEYLDDYLQTVYKKHNGDEDLKQDGYAEYNRKQALHNEKTQLLNSGEAKLRALLHFLKQGRFPWWYTDADKEQREFKQDEHTAQSAGTLPAEATRNTPHSVLDGLFGMDWLHSLSGKKLSSLKEMLLSAEGPKLRLVNHFSAAWLQQCLPLLWLIHKKMGELWEITAPVIQSFPAAGPLFHQYFWISCIENSVRGDINIITIIEKTATRQPDLAMQLITALNKVCTQHKNNNTARELASLTRKYIAEKNKTDIKEKNEAGSNKIAAEDKKAAPTITSQQLVEAALKEIFQKKTGAEESADFGEDEALFVPAAGVILLHPFLEELFKETGLWDGKEWSNAESPNRAVQLLSYLAYGEAGLPEYQLLFLKLMTGMDIETPLAAEAPLTGAEIKACTKLLAAVITHWKALRNTGKEGLQQGFLQRLGKITRSATGYQLTVERLAQDILLTRLPWGYSMIKLPWMEEMLNVTWI